MARADTPVTVNSEQARQLAIRELSKQQYHRAPLTPSPSPSPSPSTPSPSPPPHAASSFHGLTVVLVILAIFLLVVAVLLVVRRLGKPRTSKKTKSESGGRKSAAIRAAEILTGAARHRRDAELAAAAADWAAAIRERFRAVIATLDERGLLPERADRTADEAARDAGAVLPDAAEVLAAAARAFDEVEYGEYVGTEVGYEVISRVDELVLGERGGTRRLPTAVAPTVPGGAR
jgi:hypothetical protein